VKPVRKGQQDKCQTVRKGEGPRTHQNVYLQPDVGLKKRGARLLKGEGEITEENQGLKKGKYPFFFRGGRIWRGK